ncbi:hypothetical protein Y1Q_0003190 [Alligator mississippiensis]|uniref:Uncharacterized protein n=1 Tax=Alligator mississippiensis TaxID=8496 RepID=A0A151ME54_ALLMI|nr:hypothetical protein Y1Q_0003190 [Alligator mississippiensis]
MPHAARAEPPTAVKVNPHSGQELWCGERWGRKTEAGETPSLAASSEKGEALTLPPESKWVGQWRDPWDPKVRPVESNNIVKAQKEDGTIVKAQREGNDIEKAQREGNDTQGQRGQARRDQG